jgi:intein/homing endonuclease
MEKSMELDNQQESLRYELSWLGGFIDGDGCISVTRRGKKTESYNPRISMVNTNDKIIEEVIRILKNLNLPYYVHKRKSNKRWKAKTEIVIAGYKRCARALPYLIPYVHGKQEQAKLMSELIQSRFSKKHGEAYSSYELSICYKITSLNKTGTFGT